MSDVKQQAAEWWNQFLVGTPEQKAAFEKALVRLLPDGDWELYNDYDPWDLLLKAVQEAGIGCRGFMFSGKYIGFPEKTGLRLREGVLEAKQGYGAEYLPVQP